MDLWDDLTLDAAVADAVAADLLDPDGNQGQIDAGDVELDSESLARAIILQALRDLLNPSHRIALQAYDFLTRPGQDLERWSMLAGLPIDPHRLQRVPFARIRLLKQQQLEEFALTAA